MEIIKPSDVGDIASDEKHSWMHIPIRIKTKSPNHDRLRVVRFLEDAGIETRPPLTGNFLRQPAALRFKDYIGVASEYPFADQVTDSSFLVGCHHDLSTEQLIHLSSRLNAACKLLT